MSRKYVLVHREAQAHAIPPEVPASPDEGYLQAEASFPKPRHGLGWLHFALVYFNRCYKLKVEI